MENGTRVSDITKKFEKLNSKQSVQNASDIYQAKLAPLIPCGTDVIEDSSHHGSPKNLIKRSNAFRTDKFYDTTNSFSNGPKRFPLHSTVGDAWNASPNCTPNYFPKKVNSTGFKAPVKNHFVPQNPALNYNQKRQIQDPSAQISGPSRNLVHSNSRESIYSSSPNFIQGRTPPPSVNHTLPVSQFSSERLQKVLSSPLPPGPPPRKPPRTFQYGFHSESDSHSSFEDQLVKKAIVKPTLSNEINVPSRDIKKIVPYLQRSKTEPHINLRKATPPLSEFERIPAGSVDALKKKLNYQFAQSKRYSAHEVGNNNFCLNHLNCVADNNGNNIYDIPFLPAPRNQAFGTTDYALKQNQDFRKFQYSEGLANNSSNRYYEPFTPKSGRRPFLSRSSHSPDDNIGSPRTNASPSNDSLKSLHYLSTPVGCSIEMNQDIPVSGISPDHQQFLNRRNIAESVHHDSFEESSGKTFTDSDSDSNSSYVGESSNVAISREELTAERKGYVQRVLSLRCPAPQPKVTNQLFEMLLLIGISSDIERGRVPFIKASYPKNCGAAPGWLEELCFPDLWLWPPQPYLHNNYRVVLTNSEGIRKYAYCRRLQPEEAPFCLPLAYCILTSHHDPHFYYKVLAEIESRHGQPEVKFSQFVHSLFESNLPQPGATLQTRRGNLDFTIIRTEDPRTEATDLIHLLKAISVPIFLKLFSTVLLERKVILIGSNVSRLSECIEGLETALLPFIWQHTLVTTVPISMQDLCQAPTPYIVGVLRPNLDSLSFNNIDQVLAVDVDKSVVINRVGDEDSILPGRVLKALRSALSVAVVAPSNNNLLASEAIIATFVQLIGHYTQHIITSTETGLRTFQRENFVKAAESRSVQLFLEWFSETAMFTDFIETRLPRSFISGLFEMRCAELMERKVAVKKGKLNKTVKTLGDRIIDWASSS